MCCDYSNLYCATVGFSDIESSNTVGYNTDTITAKKFNMLAIPFEGVDGDGFKLNECFSGVNLTGTDSPFTADQIQFWNATLGGYENWFYYDVGDEYTGWWDAITGEVLFEDQYEHGLPAGTAFWYKSAASASQNGSSTVSGQVPAAADVDVEILKGKFNMVAYPYPVSLKLNDSTAADWSKATGTDSPFTSDQIQIWDATLGGYENWFYYDVGDEYTGWWDAITGETLFEDQYENGLVVGKPFWYKAVGSTGSFDVTFYNPVD